MSDVEIGQPLPGVYELPPDLDDIHKKGKNGKAKFPLSLLVKNAKWFCQLRWIVTASFITIGLLGIFSNLLNQLGLQIHPPSWPFVVTFVLFVTNIIYITHIRVLDKTKDFEKIKWNLWAQIIVDLIVLVIVVHFIGSLETYAQFLFLFHIVLACIFFTSWQSFIVTLLAFVLYLLCLIIELKFVQARSILIDNSIKEHWNCAYIMINIISIFGIWMTIWYLVSHLSGMLHRRDYELDELNKQLVKAQTEKSRHMLRTTHELKAPFAAIHANTQLLLDGYCGALTEDSIEVVTRIRERCEQLSHAIQEMLQLANLTSVDKDSLRWEQIDLSAVLKSCIDRNSEGLAKERGIKVETNLTPISTLGVEDHFMMLFSNLLANAIIYSKDGGIVRVICMSIAEGKIAKIIIEDHGIGILPHKLPKIFNEYYRTEEAVVHNKSSTGLGLAIVRNIAKLHKIHIRVESTPDIGTKFILEIPILKG